MDRRTFLGGAAGFAATAGFFGRHGLLRAAQESSPSAGQLPSLALTLTDTAFEIEQPVAAGRYEVTVTNAGTLVESHFALGKIPDAVTDAEYQAWLDSLAQSDGQNGETDALTWEDIEFVGVPDWPAPGGTVSGVIDLTPGRYFLFDPFSGRQYQTVIVDGETTGAPEPPSDLTVVLDEMTIDVPAMAFTAKPVRWKIENKGGMTHEVAVLLVPPDFTEEHLHLLFSMPEDATPPPGVPEFIYQPVAAIGMLAAQHTSWLDVQLTPGRYLAICMLPIATGYPHAMDGMYVFFDIA